MYVNKLENLFSRSRRRKNTLEVFLRSLVMHTRGAESNNQEFYTYSKYQAWNSENLFTLRDTVEASLCASNISQPYGLTVHPECGLKGILKIFKSSGKFPFGTSRRRPSENEFLIY